MSDPAESAPQDGAKLLRLAVPRARHGESDEEYSDAAWVAAPGGQISEVHPADVRQATDVRATQRIDRLNEPGRVARLVTAPRRLARRILTRTSRTLLTAVRRVAASLEVGPTGRLLQLSAVRAARERLAERCLEMRADDVLDVLNAMLAAGVTVWVAGGWGVDALVGRRTRRHRDLDLVVPARPADCRRSAEVLGRLGYRLSLEQNVTTAHLTRRLLFSDRVGRSVDVHPIDPSVAPFSFTNGVIGGRPVPCLTARAQLALKAAHPRRAKDEPDGAILTRLCDGRDVHG